MMGRKAVCIRWTSSASQHLWSAENMGKRKVNDPTTELSGVNNLNWKNKHEANSQQKNGTSVIGVRLIVNDVYRDLSPLASKCCIQFDPALASLLFLLFLMHSFSHVGSLCIFQSLLEESSHFFFFKVLVLSCWNWMSSVRFYGTLCHYRWDSLRFFVVDSSISKLLPFLWNLLAL